MPIADNGANVLGADPSSFVFEYESFDYLVQVSLSGFGLTYDVTGTDLTGGTINAIVADFIDPTNFQEVFDFVAVLESVAVSEYGMSGDGGLFHDTIVSEIWGAKQWIDSYTEAASYLWPSVFSEPSDEWQAVNYAVIEQVGGSVPAALTLSHSDDGILLGENFSELRTGSGDDVAIVSSTDVSIRGGWGDDILSLTDNGWGRIFGGDGGDTIIGGFLDDTLRGNNGDDFIDGLYGHDLLIGDAGDDYLVGSSGNDTLVGGTGNDSLDGSYDNNLMRAGDGDDVLYSEGSGRDTLFGGDGADLFVFQVADLDDVEEFEDDLAFLSNHTEFALVRDFDISQDIIEFNMPFGFGTGLNPADRFFEHASDQNGSVVYDDGHTRLKFFNVSLSDITEDMITTKFETDLFLG